jgi:hypothetical protein
MSIPTTRVYRVQDGEGRGPFRPGFSRHWADETFRGRVKPFPTWMQEFGADLIERLGKGDEHFGSAVRTPEKLCEWFSPMERAKLALLGYSAVSLSIYRVLAESENQLVFARKFPLHRDALIIQWPVELSATTDTSP